jgi:hypothetical protein
VHAHNDEDNVPPLRLALDHEVCSIEVDVHVVGDGVLVGHDLEDTSPDRTLEALYLDPLMDVRGPLLLFIDVKSEAEPGWVAIDRRLAAMGDALTTWEKGGRKQGRITAVLTGNADRDAIAAAPVRRAAVDGRIGDLGRDPELFVTISEKWTDHFTWVGGVDPIPPDQRLRLEGIAAEAHAGRHLLRFWQNGDRPEVWAAQVAAGVDLINTDDVAGVTAFLIGER